eukprot:TRINITY_DN6202_c0_g1_i1.p1 TRINITY_DN6202_c0_g1~~TRINITY_DN6202_c0_g1_i1.p1  ORF type:complete len:369 (-),score=73.78 TRINITY_DN6202_c0_g1_i1:1-1011(-)
MNLCKLDRFQHISDISVVNVDKSKSSLRCAVASSRLTGDTWSGAVALVECNSEGTTNQGVMELGHGGAVACAWLGADNSAVVVGCDSGSLCFVSHSSLASSDDSDAAKSRPQREVRAHAGGVSSVAVQPTDRATLLTAGTEDKLLRVWTAPYGSAAEASLPLAGHTARVVAGAWAPTCADRVFSVARDACVAVWDIRAATSAVCSLSVQLGCAPPTALVASDDDTLLVGTSDGQLYAIDVRSPDAPLWQRSVCDRGIASLAVGSADSSVVAVGDNSGRLALYSIADASLEARELYTTPTAATAAAAAAAAPVRAVAAALDNQWCVGTWDGNVCLVK